MKIKIAILGSTGSIGRSTLDIIKKNKSKFSVELLMAQNNYTEIIRQAKIFKAKNVLIGNKEYFEKIKKKLKKNKTKVFSGSTPIDKIISKKIDYTMCAIVGIAGLKSTVEASKCSRKIAIANKESIICGWNILTKYTKKYKTKILPVDSEHFSIMELSDKIKNKDVEEIILTASGGPFLNTSINKLKKISPKQAVLHPNWKMGKKISVDSATLMNKVFEIIEATKIFKFDPYKYRILIHPQSYVHSIIKYKNGLTKMLLHETDMRIPIANTIFGNKTKFKNNKRLDSIKLDKLRFFEVDKKRFPSTKFIKKIIQNGQSGPIILNASNEILVSLFLQKKIKFTDICRVLDKIIRHKNFNKYAKKKTNSLKEIYKLDQWARVMTKSFV
tara:strand:- start:404 stop:1564 length:1161 start_codon:yes stop_codon:yes gene_type:complete